MRPNTTRSRRAVSIAPSNIESMPSWMNGSVYSANTTPACVRGSFRSLSSRVAIAARARSSAARSEARSTVGMAERRYDLQVRDSMRNHWVFDTYMAEADVQSQPLVSFLTVRKIAGSAQAREHGFGDVAENLLLACERRQQHQLRQTGFVQRAAARREVVCSAHHARRLDEPARDEALLVGLDPAAVAAVHVQVP